MHELSIAMSLVDLACEEPKRLQGRVIALHIKVGPLSGVFRDALLSSYEMAICDTPLQGSQLLIEDVPILIYCPQCRAERTIETMQWFCCSVCGARVIRATYRTQMMHARVKSNFQPSNARRFILQAYPL